MGWVTAAAKAILIQKSPSYLVQFGAQRQELFSDTKAAIRATDPQLDWGNLAQVSSKSLQLQWIQFISTSPAGLILMQKNTRRCKMKTTKKRQKIPQTWSRRNCHSRILLSHRSAGQDTPSCITKVSKRPRTKGRVIFASIPLVKSIWWSNSVMPRRWNSRKSWLTLSRGKMWIHWSSASKY